MREGKKSLAEVKKEKKKAKKKLRCLTLSQQKNPVSDPPPPPPKKKSLFVKQRTRFRSSLMREKTFGVGIIN